MTAALAIQNFHQVAAGNPLDVRTDRHAPHKNDAQMEIRELEVFRADIDLVAPADAADLIEPLVELYQGNIQNGDALRLPQMTRYDGFEMRAAVSRILSSKASQPGAAPDALEKEAKMRHVLRVVEDTVANIQFQAGFNRRG